MVEAKASPSSGRETRANSKMIRTERVPRRRRSRPQAQGTAPTCLHHLRPISSVTILLQSVQAPLTTNLDCTPTHSNNNSTLFHLLTSALVLPSSHPTLSKMLRLVQGQEPSTKRCFRKTTGMIESWTCFLAKTRRRSRTATF